MRATDGRIYGVKKENTTSAFRLRSFAASISLVVILERLGFPETSEVEFWGFAAKRRISREIVLLKDDTGGGGVCGGDTPTDE